MGAVEDLRKLLQDVVTPDLKALDARLVALEKRLDGRIDGLDKKVDFRFDALDQKIDLKHDLVMAEVRNLATVISHTLDLDRRLERIEMGIGQGTAAIERTT